MQAAVPGVQHLLHSGAWRLLLNWLRLSSDQLLAARAPARAAEAALAEAGSLPRPGVPRVQLARLHPDAASMAETGLQAGLVLEDYRASFRREVGALAAALAAQPSGGHDSLLCPLNTVSNYLEEWRHEPASREDYLMSVEHLLRSGAWRLLLNWLRLSSDQLLAARVPARAAEAVLAEAGGGLPRLAVSETQQQQQQQQVQQLLSLEALSSAAASAAAAAPASPAEAAGGGATRAVQSSPHGAAMDAAVGGVLRTQASLFRLLYEALYQGKELAAEAVAVAKAAVAAGTEGGSSSSGGGRGRQVATARDALLHRRVLDVVAVATREMLEGGCLRAWGALAAQAADAAEAWVSAAASSSSGGSSSSGSGSGSSTIGANTSSTSLGGGGSERQLLLGPAWGLGGMLAAACNAAGEAAYFTGRLLDVTPQPPPPQGHAGGGVSGGSGGTAVAAPELAAGLKSLVLSEIAASGLFDQVARMATAQAVAVGRRRRQQEPQRSQERQRRHNTQQNPSTDQFQQFLYPAIARAVPQVFVLWMGMRGPQPPPTAAPPPPAPWGAFLHRLTLSQVAVTLQAAGFGGAVGAGGGEREGEVGGEEEEAATWQPPAELAAGLPLLGLPPGHNLPNVDLRLQQQPPPPLQSAVAGGSSGAGTVTYVAEGPLVQLILVLQMHNKVRQAAGRAVSSSRGGGGVSQSATSDGAWSFPASPSVVAGVLLRVAELAAASLSHWGRQDAAPSPAPPPQQQQQQQQQQASRGGSGGGPLLLLLLTRQGAWDVGTEAVDSARVCLQLHDTRGGGVGGSSRGGGSSGPGGRPPSLLPVRYWRGVAAVLRACVADLAISAGTAGGGGGERDLLRQQLQQLVLEGSKGAAADEEEEAPARVQQRRSQLLVWMRAAMQHEAAPLQAPRPVPAAAQPARFGGGAQHRGSGGGGVQSRQLRVLFAHALHRLLPAVSRCARLPSVLRVPPLLKGMTGPYTHVTYLISRAMRSLAKAEGEAAARGGHTAAAANAAAAKAAAAKAAAASWRQWLLHDVDVAALAELGLRLLAALPPSDPAAAGGNDPGTRGSVSAGLGGLGGRGTVEVLTGGEGVSVGEGGPGGVARRGRPAQRRRRREAGRLLVGQ
ncbi:hypothetical protein HYH02_015311 [Chlamydomonas schloesseri]|uniref:Uncharacterized protein n=1 Tax=Chlamydomonas schloesseri TaxID=2026947 RepID=A0A835VSC2_9CHLO|nr:hypothetical protein HYH02_015311 [Chlamydomonas schloesseri]|eukprot:KAG2423611.1 hypothetical protein HYH02_015311 [Chlamydomonas schloesseri]